MIDLAPHHLETVRSILAEHVPDCEVRAFGSRAKWEGWEYSDLDLAVLCGDGEDRRVIARLKEAFENSDLPIRVDVLDWHAIADDFRKVIDSDCVVVQAATGFEDSRGAIEADSAESLQPIRALGFQTIRLDGIATIVMGQSPPGSTYNEAGDGLPFYQGATDFGNRYPARRVYCSAPTRTALLGDVLITVRAPIGRVNRATEHCAIGRGIAVVRAETRADTDYLEYVFRDLHDHWHALEADGTVFGNARKSDLMSLEIPWPAEEERRAIAGVLGALDDKIELNRRMSETLEEMARAQFRSWFVDFDPVRAKAEDRPSGLPPDLDALFPSSFEESELGEIPAGWKVRRLGDLAETIRGRSYRSSELTESDTALVTLKSFARGGGYRPDGLKPYVGEYKIEQIIEPGELVIACTDVTQAADVVGRPAVVPADRRFATLVASLDTLIVRPLDAALNMIPFLYHLMSTSSFTQYTYSRVSGTTVLHLSREEVPAFEFPAPPPDLMHAFATLAAPTHNRMLDSSAESAMLVAQRDALVPRLLSGKLRVGGVKGSMRTVS